MQIRDAFESADAALARSRAAVAQVEHELTVADGRQTDAFGIDDRHAHPGAVMAMTPIRPRAAIAAELNTARVQLAAATEFLERHRLAAKRELISR